MSDFIVAKITEEDALALNQGLSDDDKVAFQNDNGTEFWIKDPNDYPTTLPSSKYEVKLISKAEVDGSFPVTKRKRIYP